MKTYNDFPDRFDYHSYLYKEDSKGLLPDNTVDQAAREEMAAQVLADEPEDGVYLEVGPAHHPYYATSTRDFTRLHYVGADGGKSEDNQGMLRGHGWTEYPRGIFVPDATLAAQRMRSATGPDGTPKRATFLWADAQHLPFLDKNAVRQDGTPVRPIREIFMRDVLLESVIHPRSVEGILREQARVLTVGGMLVIRETSFSRYHHPRQAGRSAGYLSLMANLEHTGFGRRTIIFDNDKMHDKCIFPDLLQKFPGGQDGENLPYDTETGPMAQGSRFAIGYYLLCQQGEAEISQDLSRWQRLKNAFLQ